ncbi:MAG: hypothetical protein U0K91_07230 [Acutalibacteraceae bacterium]|nr:hypothetical protein [Acutalibacteraceae bacterium]
MEINENLATEEVAENVEITTEEIPVVEERTYRQTEVDSIVGKAKGRAKAQAKKEFDREYGELLSVLKAGTGKESVKELTDTFAEFYKSKGVEIPKQPTYSERDIEVLATAEADEIIGSGYEEVIEEANRLSSIGADKMTTREKALFLRLNNHIRNAESERELSKIGVKEDVYRSDAFVSFAKKFEGSKTPITEIYEIYNKTLPKKEIKPMGSIKNTTVDKGVKDFYSREEALKFTKADFDKDPALYNAVVNSMQKW